MKKTLIISITILALFLIIGCSSTQECTEPNVQIDSECCLDVNNDLMCDTEEPLVKEPEVTIEEEPETPKPEEVTLPQEILDLKKNADKTKSIRFIDHRTNNYYMIKGQKAVLVIEVTKLNNYNFYYNKIYIDAGNETALGFCDNVYEENTAYCRKNPSDKYVVLNYTDFIIPDPYKEIKELDNGKIHSTIECENRICVIIEFLKEDIPYYLYVREKFPVAYKMFPVGAKNSDDLVYISIVFNDVKDEEIEIPEEYTEQYVIQKNVQIIMQNIKKLDGWIEYVEKPKDCYELTDLYEETFKEEIVQNDLEDACSRLSKEIE